MYRPITMINLLSPISCHEDEWYFLLTLIVSLLTTWQPFTYSSKSITPSLFRSMCSKNIWVFFCRTKKCILINHFSRFWDFFFLKLNIYLIKLSCFKCTQSTHWEVSFVNDSWPRHPVWWTSYPENALYTNTLIQGQYKFYNALASLRHITVHKVYGLHFQLSLSISWLGSNFCPEEN